jgi:environmental stress-induced protein Ves
LIRRIAPADHIRVPWKNGGGVSATIAGERLPGTMPGDWGGMVWQLGRTAIVEPGPFSDLSGFERLQVVVRGEGLFLDGPSGAIDLSRTFSVARYDGGTPVVSRLEGGPVEVVNLIARRDRTKIGLTVLRPGESHPATPGIRVIYACAGAAQVRISAAPQRLEDDHAIMLDVPVEIRCDAGVVVIASVATA